jgi:protein-disulfide isomerase
VPRRKQQAQASSLKPFYVILGIVAVIGVGAIFYAMRGGADAAVTQPLELSGIEDAQALIARARGVAAGPAEAPVQVLVFSDYMCPYCAQFALGVGQRLKSDYVQPGQVQFVYYDFPLGRGHVHSFIAARAARCAEDQGRFWEYHDLLFARQNDWMYERNTPFRLFDEYARQVGLNESTFRSCVNSDQHADLVTANRRLGEQLGVSATPWVFVNGRRMDQALDWGAMRRLIDEHLAE